MAMRMINQKPKTRAEIESNKKSRMNFLGFSDTQKEKLKTAKFTAKQIEALEEIIKRET